jgi:predicted glutamine amidotransferase
MCRLFALHAGERDVAAENTHPFSQDGRLFAHNGGVDAHEARVRLGVDADHIGRRAIR